MSLEYRVGDVFERLAEIPDGSIDLIVSSPPFLALRSYLPDDHPDKHKEIGQEPTPAEFIDTHLALSAEYARVLAPHGSLCYEIGDTYSGSGGHGGDYAEGGMRDGQPKFKGSASKGDNWPLAKSMCIIPHLFTASLAYGRNLLTGEPSPAGEWRIRNVICWARNNPPVGALGDKFRPATSYITVACKSGKRYFDLDAVRRPYSEKTNARVAAGVESQERTSKTSPAANRATLDDKDNDGAGAPPLDWHTDGHPEDGDWLWQLNTQPYSGAHFATYPMTLPKRMIEAMCPRKVCNECGKPSERMTGEPTYVSTTGGRVVNQWAGDRRGDAVNQWDVPGGNPGHAVRTVETLGWTDCGHDDWRTGNVLDPFAGSGTTIEAAQAVGRHAIGIDLDERNADLARERVGMFLEVNEGAA